MFTIEQIEQAHNNVKSGADFPNYIQALKKLGVIAFETYVKNSSTIYFDINNHQAISKPQYSELEIVDTVNKENFIHFLRNHQEGKTDYFTFCRDCAITGIKKWIVLLDKMTCTYYDNLDNIIWEESIPSIYK